jgi:hypothetical protein
MKNGDRSWYAAVLVLPVLLAVPCTLLGQGAACVEGSITAEINTDHPELGDWKYTISIAWNSPHGLSHWDLWIDDTTNCTCEEIGMALTWEDPAGSSDGEGGCTVEYSAELKCSGDPSIDLDGILIKFEPSNNCEPGQTGSGEFYFYSDYPPAPIQDPNSPPHGFLINKNGNSFCDGELSGVFPGLPCNPTADEAASWGILKSIYQ